MISILALITQKDLPTLLDAPIGIQTYSNHVPISLTLTSPESHTKPCMWRLNPSILTDPDSLQKMTETLHNYFSENGTENLSPFTIGEAIRGGTPGSATKPSGFTGP